jgi:hypothetical protein
LIPGRGLLRLLPAEPAEPPGNVRGR